MRKLPLIVSLVAFIMCIGYIVEGKAMHAAIFGAVFGAYFGDVVEDISEIMWEAHGR